LLCFLGPAWGRLTKEWVSRNNGGARDWGTALAVDSQGNVYVTGTSEIPRDWGWAAVTIKYDPDGRELWVRRFRGPASDDSGVAIAVDARGNVYVAGYSEQDWGSFCGDFVTIKYSQDGQELWVRRYNGPANDHEFPTALALDSRGNVYVTGCSTSAETGTDIITIKYDPDGQEQWIRPYAGPGAANNFAWAMAVDGQDNVLVTGQLGEYPDSDFVTIKYSPDGQELWSRSYNGPDNWDDAAVALVVDYQGNAYVTGSSGGLSTEGDYATIKYSPDGQELWVRQYKGDETHWNNPAAIAVDRYGNVYVTGTSTRGEDWEAIADYATIKYNPDGRELWVRRFNRTGKDYGEAYALALDSQGSIYVTGFSEGVTGSHYLATVKYSPAGRQLWAEREKYRQSLFPARFLVLDSQDNILLTGDDYRNNICTIKYRQPRRIVNPY